MERSDKNPRDPIAVLLSLTERLAQEAPLEEHLAAVTDVALVLLPGDHASIRLVDDSGNELFASARSGAGAGRPSLPLRKGEGIAGWVLEHARAAVVADTLGDPRFLRSTGQGFSIRSLVAAPLLHLGRAIGVLSVSSAQPAAFGDAHETMARLLASCSVPALERARLARLAVTDDLTLAHNGRYLVPRLSEELERARREGHAVSVAMLDLDHFKRVNDTLGHARGDAVLRMFADRVRDKTRRSDIFVRRGGEEFVLLLPTTPAPQALALSERIRHAIADDPFVLEGGVRVTQTVSVGVASWDRSESAERLVHRADLAMYAAKQGGRNRVEAADFDVRG